MCACPIGAFPHIIRPYDSIWQLAQQYGTTAEAIIRLNPGLDPYHMYVGQAVCVRPGGMAGAAGMPAAGCICKAEVDLRNTMRTLWEQHVAWTRMTIISIAEGLKDVDLVTARLLRNPSDFEAVLAQYYGSEKAAGFAKLFREHLVIAAQLVKAAKAGNTAAAADAEKRWYANADQIAAYLHSINPYWSEEALRRMLYDHLAMTKSEAVYRLRKNYAADIKQYDMIEQQALQMADAFSEGIVKQFPGAFTCA